MTKQFWRTRQKLFKSPDNSPDGSTSVPSGLTSTTAARFTGTDGEVFDTTTGALGTVLNISSSTNASPIVITTSGAHGLQSGQTVIVGTTAGAAGTSNHTVNTNANGTWVVTVLTTTTFSLTNSTGNGVGGATGTVTPVVEGRRDALAIPSITGTAHGAFTANDLGRLIKLTNTPPTAGTAGTLKNDNWVFRIAAVISSTVVQLEGARFEDVSSVGAGAVHWTLMACTEFTATSTSANFSSDPVNGQGGSMIDRHISIPNPGNAALQLKYVPWRIGRVDSGTTLLVNDWTGNVDSFPIASSLSWFAHDRQAFNYEDFYMIFHRFMFQAGWVVKGVQATGTIIAGANPVSGDWVTIWDGQQRFTLEWNNGAPGANHTAVAFVGGNATTNASNLATAINGLTYASGVSSNLSATSSGSTVTITSKIYDAKANTLIFTGASGNTGATSPWVSASANSFGALSGMSGGMTAGQFRGRNNGPGTNDNIQQDVIWFSNGEGDPSDPKRMTMRVTKGNSSVTGLGNSAIDFAMWQSWLPVFVNTSTHNQGNGINPCKSPSTSGSSRGAGFATDAITTATLAFSSATAASTAFPTNFVNELSQNPYGLSGGTQVVGDYVLFGDKDEIHVYFMIESVGANYIGFGAIQEVNQNPQRFMVRASVTAGANAVIDVGPNTDPQAAISGNNRDGTAPITPPYQTNDELQAAGLAVNTGAPTGGAFIESDQATNFGTIAASATNPDGLDYSITVATLNKTLQIGDIVGEEAMPMFLYQGPHFTFATQGNGRVQNEAQHGDATFFDWNNTATNSTTNDGFNVTDGLGTLGANATSEIAPNKRGGRFGAVPIVFRDTVEGQFRGRMRYFYVIPGRTGTLQLMPDRNNTPNWYITLPYVLRQTQVTGFKIALGPIPNNVARAL
jgi:hypothetical protein